MINLQHGSNSDAFQVGNSAMTTVTYIGDLPGTFYDKYGEVQHSGTLRNVSYSEDNAFNLISFPQLLMLLVLEGPRFDLILSSLPRNAVSLLLVSSGKMKIAALHLDGKEEKVRPSI
jgi:hypothetical protein